MLYALSLLKPHWRALNVFQYITFRAGGAALTALGASLLLGPRLIAALQKRKVGQIQRQGLGAGRSRGPGFGQLPAAQDHPQALPVQGLGDGQADPAVGAGDEGGAERCHAASRLHSTSGPPGAERPPPGAAYSYSIQWNSVAQNGMSSS